MSTGYRFPVVDKLSGAAIKLSELTFSYGSSPQPTVFSDVTISAQSDSCIAVVRGLQLLLLLNSRLMGILFTVGW